MTEKRKKSGRTKTPHYEGSLITNRKGFGFVECPELEEDVFIAHSRLNGAFHKDTVRIELLKNPSGRRMEGRVLKIVERGIKSLTGSFQRVKNYGFVVPDNTKVADDIFIPGGYEKGAKDGDKVVVSIESYGGNGQKPEGRITEVLGRPGDKGVDILSVIRGHELPEAFPEEVKKAAEAVPAKVYAKDLKNRKDLRRVRMVTIDGEDSKDLDDAVSLSKKGSDYILGVHIADVSHYVKEDSVLDREALERGTSVYLADRVIPMLPERLSNGICSLNEGEERLAMSCIMRIGKNGAVKEYEITPSVIKVNRRMTYTAVAGILDGDEGLRIKYKKLVPMFEEMAELAVILKKMRSRRGSIDFDLPETEIVLDEDGHVTDIRAHERNAATSMIEQFMLSANETVAGLINEKELPFVYRIHETPDADRIEDLLELLRSFGYKVKGKAADIKPKEIQKLLAGCVGKPEEKLIHSLALRSMKQARYSTKCVGHFGLAATEYCHFTSPIRRYPDLQIHRILKEVLSDKLKKKRRAHYEGILEKVAKQSSDRERRAVDAERDVDKLKMAEYMKDHFDQEFEGVISGVTGWGMYVQLPNTVEGMVPIAKIPGDDFVYSEKDYALVGRFSKRRYRLGEKATVRVEKIDDMLHTIDFELVCDNVRTAKRGKKGEKGRNKARRKQ